jgi:hypothetical protein
MNAPSRSAIRGPSWRIPCGTDGTLLDPARGSEARRWRTPQSNLQGGAYQPRDPYQRDCGTKGRGGASRGALGCSRATSKRQRRERLRREIGGRTAEGGGRRLATKMRRRRKIDPLQAVIGRRLSAKTRRKREGSRSRPRQSEFNRGSAFAKGYGGQVTRIARILLRRRLRRTGGKPPNRGSAFARGYGGHVIAARGGPTSLGAAIPLVQITRGWQVLACRVDCGVRQRSGSLARAGSSTVASVQQGMRHDGTRQRT